MDIEVELEIFIKMVRVDCGEKYIFMVSLFIFFLLFFYVY